MTKENEPKKTPKLPDKEPLKTVYTQYSKVKKDKSKKNGEDDF